jgi:protocatechuate 3,4-dioxygenase beta subunit
MSLSIRFAPRTLAAALCALGLFGVTPSTTASARAAELANQRASAELPAPSEPPARIHGRVLDERGLPLVGARVALAAMDGAWREGVAVAHIEHAGERREGFATLTASDGSFSIEAPAPSSSWIELRVEAGFALLVERRTFGGSRSGPTELIVAGDNSLGELVPRAAGWIRGRVVDPYGDPVIGAELSLEDNERPAPTTRTDAQGRYAFLSVRPGGHLVRATRPGRGKDFERVKAKAGREAVVDLRLSPAPYVRGTVVDPSGTPLAGVTLYGMYTTMCMVGDRTITRTRADGSFEMQTFGPIDSVGFEPYVGTEVVEPAGDLRLVLSSSTRVRLRALDARTGSAIERYAARAVIPTAWRYEEFSPQISWRDAADGISELQLDPAHSWLECAAPGYAPYEGPLQFDTPDRTSATVRLHPGARVRGRWPARAHPSVRLVGLRFPREAGDGSPAPSSATPPRSFPCAPLSFLGKPRTVIGSADGSFEFDSLAAGWYELRAQAEGESPRVIEGFWLGNAETLELGDLLGIRSEQTSR